LLFYSFKKSEKKCRLRAYLTTKILRLRAYVTTKNKFWKNNFSENKFANTAGPPPENPEKKALFFFFFLRARVKKKKVKERG
jgi:hypothetical protein